MPENAAVQEATFGGGCFWCTEAVFDTLKGVERVESGYAGGHVADPTYEEVCGKRTGHAEVIRIAYDPDVISYRDLLDVFFATHDPTTPNRQGNDVGPQYRSVVYAHDEAQAAAAREAIARLDAEGAFAAPIVTAVEPLTTYYPAEEYHQGYYAANPAQGYCNAVIPPKLAKLRAKFADKLR